jgi:Fic family protein
MTFIHERKDWPVFDWDQGALSTKLADVRHRQGRLLGRMGSLGFDLRNEAMLSTLTQDVLKSSEIEGQFLDADQVRSSIARRLGIDTGGLVPADRDVEGVVEMMLDATRNYDQPMNAERLFDWHASLFPTGRSGMSKIIVGAWRDDSSGAMQVVSGAIGRERVHFQAPDAKLVEKEMTAFLQWFEKKTDTDLVIKAAIAHLWFVTIHPFEDGNGRIARAIADMALARSEQSPQRFYSMSTQIRVEREAYYDMLESAQKGDLDITEWLDWFLDCLGRAIDGAETILKKIFIKAHFWEKHGEISFNPRQRKMLNRLLDDFKGKLTSSKWAKMQKCSPDTALRDINELISHGILTKEPGGGRSTSYALVQDGS